jgi:hypothetical protein
MGLAQKKIIENYHGKKGGRGQIITVPVHQPNLHVLQILDGNQHGKAALSKNGVASEIRRLLREWSRLINGGDGFEGYGHGAVAGMIHKFLHDILIMAFLADQDPESTGIDMDKVRGALERRKLAYGSEQWNKAMQALNIPLDPAQARMAWNITIEDVLMLGHWNRDDRGHNRWENAKAMFCWGAPLEPVEEYQINYQIYRTVMKWYGVELEEWDGSVIKPQEIETNGGETLLTTNFPMPTVADARAFILDSVNAQIAQAIGRLRGVRRTADNPANVFLYMGDYPVAAIGADHMLPEIEYRTSLDSPLAARAEKEMAIIKETAMTREEELCVASITRALNEKYSFLGKNQIGKRTVRKHLNTIRDIAESRRISIQMAAEELAREIFRFLPDPTQFPRAKEHTRDRLEDRVGWTKMWMGYGPEADTVLTLMDELAEIFFASSYAKAS